MRTIYKGLWFLLAIIIISLTVLSAVSGLPTLEFDGDTVFVNDSKAYIGATPHTVVGTQPVEVVIESKVYSGNLHLGFGYNGDYLTPFRIDRWNPHEECTNYGNESDYCYEVNWTQINVGGIDFVHFERELNGKTDWYAFPNVNFVAGVPKKFRIWIEAPYLDFGMTQEEQYPDYDGKYDIVAFPSSWGTNIQGANDAGQLYILDPTVDLTTGLHAVYTYDVDEDDDFSTYDVTPVGDATTTSGGISNNHATFDGTGDYFTAPNNYGIFENNFAVSFWVKTSTDGGGIFTFYDERAVMSRIGQNCPSDKISWRIGTTAGVQILCSTTSVTDGIYHHVVGVKTSTGGMYLYVDGTLEDSQTDADAQANTGAYSLGSAIGTQDVNYLNGQIDEFYIYDGSLNQTQVTALYNSGYGFFYPFSTSSDPFIISAVNGFNSSALTVFNATIDGGSVISTTNGTLNTDLLQNSTLLHNITINAEDHFSITLTDYNVSSNYEGTMYQSDVSIACFEKITNNSLTCDETDLARYNAGTHEITANVTGYYSIVTNITINALDNKTINIEGFYDGILTIEARDKETNASVNDFNITITELVSNYTETLNSGATNQTVFYLVENLNYTIVFDKENFVGQTLNRNFTEQKIIFNVSSVAIRLIFYDELTENAVNNVTYRYYFPSYAISGNTGATNQVYLPLNETGLLQIEYEKDGYSLRHYYITVTNTTTEDIDLYLLNQSATNFITVTFTVTDENGVALSDAIVRLQRSFIQSGLRTFITVDSDNSNFNGEGVLTAQEDIVDYIFTVEYNNVNCLTSDPTQIFGGTVSLVCTTGEDVISGWISTYGVTSTITFNETTGFTASYNDISSGVSEVCLEIKKNSGLGITIVNYPCSSATSATFSNIGYGNETGDYTATLIATLGGDKVIINSYNVQVTNGSNLGSLGIFLAFMLVVVSVTLAIYSPEMGIVFAIISVVFTKIIGLIPLSFGAVTLIVVVGGILLYSIRRGVSA